MIEKIKSYSNTSKYTTVYCNIVQRAIGRAHTKCNEKHHIVPKSIWKDGAKLKANIVSLSPREHFICHRLLTKMLLDLNDRNKMLFAFHLMTKTTGQCKITSTIYEYSKKCKSLALVTAWKDRAYREKQTIARAWFYQSIENKETNSQKALIEMQDENRKNKFVKAGLDACKKIREADTKEWVSRSMGSEHGRAKAKIVHQSKEHRKTCSERELSKSKEERVDLAKKGQQALIEKLGGEEAYRKYLSERIKGRKKYIHPDTLDIKVSHTAIDGYILYTEYSRKVA